MVEIVDSALTSRPWREAEAISSVVIIPFGPKVGKLFACYSSGALSMRQAMIPTWLTSSVIPI